ncbi:MAG: hypothetical protein GX205_08010 [Firmicutes bacterium]|nr:hypothetical protein [Bacillota bacterium]
MYNATAVLYALVIPALIALLLVVILVLGLRWFKYRERMAAIQRSAAAAAEVFADDSSEQQRKRQLAAGITTALVGLALTIGLFTMGVGPWLLIGLVPFFVGLSMILTYLITQPEKEQADSPAAEMPAAEPAERTDALQEAEEPVYETSSEDNREAAEEDDEGSE